MTGATIAEPSSPSRARTARLPVFGLMAALIFAATQAFGLFTTPPDRDMGNLVKILFVHVPAAQVGLLAVATLLVSSGLYLWKREEKYDLVAASAAEVGAVLTGLTLALGSIWGRPTWGVWWTWDPRLTSTAVQLLILVSYLALRSFVDDSDRRAVWSAAVGILGGLNVPIVYMSVKWWRTLHQMQSSPSTVDPAYAWGLRLNDIAMLLLLIYFVRRRFQAARVQREAEQVLESVALGRALPGEASHG
jgi:heme exporter protein C